MSSEINPWYKEWFASPYYPLLYPHRDSEEAQLFISHILRFLPIPPAAQVLDIACGEGRHAHVLHDLGFQVTGIDASKPFIHKASTPPKLGLTFQVGDIRNPFPPGPYHLILNLFTSFGYFQDIQDQFKVLHNVTEVLDPRGYFILDFFNANWVEKILIPEKELEINNIHFHIRKKIINKRIIKRITISEGSQTSDYCEDVALFTRIDLENMGKEVGLIPFATWGSYTAEPFDEVHSERCILFFQYPQP